MTYIRDSDADLAEAILADALEVGKPAAFLFLLLFLGL